MNSSMLKEIDLVRYTNNQFTNIRDVVIIEEPLEIRLVFGPIENRLTKSIAITMRTPGFDEELALGFLFNECIIKEYGEVLKVSKNTYHKGELNENIITVNLKPNIVFDEMILNRNFYTTSSCGICGKSSIDAISLYRHTVVNSSYKISYESILKMNEEIRKGQYLFSSTGGNHGVALVNDKNNLIFEDVGRHNALDKLVGKLLLSNLLSIVNYSCLFLSGRISFELVQKAVIAGFPIIVAVGAPSSLAIELAEKNNICLVGFTKPSSFNVYTHHYRIT